MSPAAACRISTASPCHPGPRPAPGCDVYEASARVHCYSPHASLPLACGPGRNGTLGLSPGLHTRLSRTQPRMPGRGRARTLPGLRPWHQPASFDALTHHVRPHVATINHLVAGAPTCAPRTQVRLAAPFLPSPAAAGWSPQSRKARTPPANTPSPGPPCPRPPGNDPLPGGRIKDALQAPATPAGLPPGP